MSVFITVGTNGRGAESHRQGQEFIKYWEMTWHIVSFAFFLGFVDNRKIKNVTTHIFKVLLTFWAWCWWSWWRMEFVKHRVESKICLNLLLISELSCDNTVSLTAITVDRMFPVMDYLSDRNFFTSWACSTEAILEHCLQTVAESRVTNDCYLQIADKFVSRIVFFHACAQVTSLPFVLIGEMC